MKAFFTAALKAGGRIHGEPALRDAETGYYSAAVLDFDGNSIEVVHRSEHEDDMARSTISDHPEGSRVLTWQNDIAKSTASGATATSSAVARTFVNNITTPTVVVSHQSSERPFNSEASSKALIGTLLGAAAGAALAFVMTKGEEESAHRYHPEPGRAITTTVYQAIEAPSPRSMVSSSSHRQYQPPSASSQAPSTSLPLSYHSSRPRAIEAPPLPSSRSTLIDTFVPPTEVARYATASSPRSHISRAQTDILTIRTRHSVPYSHSHAPSSYSAARTVTQADFLPPPLGRTSSSPSTIVSTRDLSPQASSKAGSRISLSRSKHGSETKVREGEREKGGSKAPTLIGSILGLGSVAPSDSISQASFKKARNSRRSSRRSSSHRLVEINDDDVVVPEDSISQVGSERTVRGKGRERSVASLPMKVRESGVGGKEREARSVVSMGVGMFGR